MATGSQWKFGADASEYKRVVREMPSEMDKAASKIEGRTKQMSGKVSRFMGELGSLIAGGAIVSGLTSLLKKMDDISDGARRIGISSTEFQKIGNAAELVGTSVEAVNKAMIRAGVAANKAAREGGTMADAFARANLDPAKFAAAGLEERIKMVAEAQRSANGDAQKMSELFEAIGVKAAGIDFASLADEMANVNAASDSTVEALARANDELDKAKQNATIFGANLLKGISDASERLGSLLAGGTGQTMQEMDEQVARDNAIAALRNRGELLPDDSTIKRTSIPTPAGPVMGGQEIVKGPNAQENERRIAAEITAQEELNKAKEQETRLAKEAADAERDQHSAAAERAAKEAEIAQTKKQIADIDLKIKEAQASGNEALAADLSEYKDLIEAAIKYEGDLDMAARDVNASYEKRNRLIDEANTKLQQSIEAELKRVETMAYGTKEAKAQAEWMDEYNKRISEGATDEQAKRFANAKSYEPPQDETQGAPKTGEAPVGSGGGSLRGGYSDKSNWTENMRVADLRGQARQASWDQRASDLASRGMFRSAIRAQDHGQRAYDRAMESAQIRDASKDYDFAGRQAQNIGEAYQAYKTSTGIEGRMSEKEFKDYLREQSQNPAERSKQEEEQANKERRNSPEGGGRQATSVDSIAQKILEEIKKRLPVVALG